MKLYKVDLDFKGERALLTITSYYFSHKKNPDILEPLQ